MTPTRALSSTAAAAALLLVAAGGTAQTPVAAPAASEQTVADHVAAATRLAGDDLRGLMVLCKPAPATRPSVTNAGIAQQIARPAPPPGRAFDNLAYVGARWVSAWALQTSEGTILLDALDNAAEAKTLIEGGMTQLGLDPARIKTIVVSHAHGDHYGGAPYLIERYHARVVMSQADWQMSETALEFALPLWGDPPKRGPGDRAVNDGDTYTLGDTTLTFYLTAGHTLGTLTTVFDVKSRPQADDMRRPPPEGVSQPGGGPALTQSSGATHRAMLWGGTAFNFGRDILRMEHYIASTARMAQVAQAQGISVLLSNHPDYDGTVLKLPAAQSASGANPFVIGTPAVVRALTVMGECAQAQRDRYVLMP